MAADEESRDKPMVGRVGIVRSPPVLGVGLNTRKHRAVREEPAERPTACGAPSADLAPQTPRGFPKAQPARAWGHLSLPRSSLSPVQDLLCQRKPQKGHSEEHTAGKQRELCCQTL